MAFSLNWKNEVLKLWVLYATDIINFRLVPYYWFIDFVHCLLFQTEYFRNVASTEMTVFWDLVPCSLIEIDQSFRRAFCLHRQGNCVTIEAVSTLKQLSISTELNSTKSHKTVIFIGPVSVLR
jgi:hypothetical protein